MRRLILVPAAVAMSIAWQGGCGRGPDGPSGSPAQGPTSARPVVAVPTEEEARQFAEQFADAAMQGDGDALTRMIDWEAMLDEATRGIEVPDKVRREFAEGFINESRNGKSGLARPIVAATSQGGSFAFIRLTGGKAKQSALFRLLLPEGGVNYLEIQLARGADGSTRGVDAFSYSAGTSIGQGVRNVYMTVAADSQRNLIDRLTGKEQVFLTHLPKLTQMNTDLFEGRPQAVLDTYNTLPEELKRDRFFLVARFTAAQQINDDEYAAALAAFSEAFPDDASADLRSIDAHFLQGRHDEALAAVDRVDHAVGGDPYLDVLRSNLLFDRGDIDAAREAASRAREADPSLIDASWSLVSIALRERDFDETARLLDVIGEEFEVEFFDLTSIPDYAEFVRSPQYDAWLSRRPAPPADGVSDAMEATADDDDSAIDF